MYACEDGVVIASSTHWSYGNNVKISHGDGYVSLYAHNSRLLVSPGETVVKGQPIAIGGNTGNSSGPHVHFEIMKNGATLNPLDFKYENGLGGEGEFGTSSDNSYAVIAKFTSSNTQTTDYKNENEAGTTSESTFKMTTDKINYQELVSSYTMPFNYLWAMLLVSGDKDFVMELADLVYDSNIEITIYDNVTTKIDEEIFEYVEVADIEADVAITVVREELVDNKIQNVQYSNSETFNESISTNYKSKKVMTTVTDTPNVKVTLADCWFVEYKDEYQKSNVTNVIEPYIYEMEDEIGNVVSLLQNEDKYGYIAALYNSVSGTGTIVNKTVNKYIGTEQISKTNQKQTTNITINTNTYTSTGAVATGKDERFPNDSSEVNFVTLITKPSNINAKYNLLDITDWLFQLIEANENTVDMLDLTKYLLYKVTGIDYGVTTLDFNLFTTSNSISYSGSNSLLKQMIRKFEGTGQAASDPTKYRMYLDAGNHLTVGYGILLNHATSGNTVNGNAISALGYVLQEGVEVPKDIVDAMEEEELNSTIEKILQDTEGLNLTDYQINALVSRAYNCR